MSPCLPVRLHSTPPSGKPMRGFTLIEVMIVVAIIGALAAIAMPMYNDYVIKSRVNEAVAGLSDLRVKMEQFFQDSRTYVGACAAGTVTELPANTKFFDFACSNLAATTYTITATGKIKHDGLCLHGEPGQHARQHRHRRWWLVRQHDVLGDQQGWSLLR
jgi:prepilin-type N-terminal cleavage/methylation domain-containing protein